MLDRLDFDTYYLVADTTDIGRYHRALVLSLAYHKRSLPLVWHVEPGSKGHTSENIQVELIRRLYAHFQPEATVIFLGDSEFDGVKVQRQLDQQGWYYICRTSPRLYVYPDGEDKGFPLDDLAPESGSPERQLDSVEFTAPPSLRAGFLLCLLGRTARGTSDSDLPASCGLVSTLDLQATVLDRTSV